MFGPSAATSPSVACHFDRNTRPLFVLCRLAAARHRRTGRQITVCILNAISIRRWPWCGAVAWVSGATVRCAEAHRQPRNCRELGISNDNSVGPSVMGRFVEGQVDLTAMTLAFGGTVVAVHVGHWGHRATIT